MKATAKIVTLKAHQDEQDILAHVDVAVHSGGIPSYSAS